MRFQSQHWRTSLLLLSSALWWPSNSLGQTTYDWTATTGNWTSGSHWYNATAETSGAMPPSSTNNLIINLINGTSESAATTTLNAAWVLNRNSSLTLGAQNTLELAATLNMTQTTGSLANHGVVKVSSVGSLQTSSHDTSVVNSGKFEASAGGTFTLHTVALTNASGVVKAMSGGTIRFVGNNRVNGGSFQNEVGGNVFQNGLDNANQNLTYTGVTVSNFGAFTNEQDTTGAAVTPSTGIRTILAADTLFTNASGATLQVLNTGGGNTTTTNARNSGFVVDTGATFHNQGTLRIQNSATRTGSLTGQAVSFSVASGATAFSNSGTIEVFAISTGTGATADFTSAKSVANEGVVHIKGNANSEFATLSVTGDGNDYTQSGNGSQRTLLEQGGVLSVTQNVTISAGSLGGVGTISGATVIGSDAVLFAGETLSGTAGAGILAFEGSLTLGDGAELRLGLGIDTATSARISLDGDLFLGTNLTLSLDDLSGGAWTEGESYQIIELTSGTIHGDLASFALGLPTGWEGMLTRGVGGSSLNVTLTAIPEPTSVSLLLGSLTAATLLARRRRRI